MQIFTADTSAHEKLKEETKVVHESLHHHPVIATLFSPQLSSDAYANLLSAYYGFIFGLETQRQASGMCNLYSLSEAVSALRDDLSIFGTNTNSLPIHRLMPLSSKEDCLGALYVMHGARLGGKIIAQRVSKTLVGAPVKYFASEYGIDLWRLLLKDIEKYHPDEASFKRLIDKALNTFEAFSTWMYETHK